MEWFKFIKRLDRSMYGRPGSVRESGEFDTERTEQPIALRALEVARQEIGNGEDGGNNRGTHVEVYRAGDGTGRKVVSRESWCASFASFCFERAKEDGESLPFKTSRGAKRLVKNVGKAGRFLDGPLPGALIAWNRGTNASNAWQGHVAICSEYDAAADTLKVIEGNFGPYPALVSERRIIAGLWRKRLFRIAFI